MFSYEFKGALTMPVHQGGGVSPQNEAAWRAKRRAKWRALAKFKALTTRTWAKNNLWHSIMIGKKQWLPTQKKSSNVTCIVIIIWYTHSIHGTGDSLPYII